MAVLQWLNEAIPLQTIPSSFQLAASFFLVLLLSYHLLLKKASGRTRSQRFGKKSNLPPGPRKLPIIGNLHQLSNMPHLSLHRLSQRFGPIFHLQLGEIPTVVVSSARMAKEVMKTYDLAISSRPQMYSAKHLFYNCTDVVFSPYVGEYDRHGFQTMLDEYQVLLGGFSVENYFPSMEWINTLTEGKLPPVDVLLDLKNSGSVEMPLTMDNIKAIILDMFAAGTDTTLIVLDWGMTELIMNPIAMQKAQTEVRRIVLESDLPQLHYQKAVIKEIFRLHPPVPVLVPRESMEDETMEGYDISAKTRFLVTARAIGRDPDSWENPQIFKPERFIGSNADFKVQDFDRIPFGAGRRSCPAIAFGTAIVELALAQGEGSRHD